MCQLPSYRVYTVQIYNTLHLRRKYAQTFVRSFIYSEKRTVFRGRNWWKTVSFEERTMSKDKYPRLFWKSKRGLLCLLSFEYFLQDAGSLKNWGIPLWYSQIYLWNIQSRDAFRLIEWMSYNDIRLSHSAACVVFPPFDQRNDCFSLKCILKLTFIDSRIVAHSFFSCLLGLLEA